MNATVAVRPIRTDADMDAAMARLREIWDPEPGTSEADEAEVLTVLIQAYDREHYPLPPSNPVSAILFHMERLGLTTEDLVPLLGSQAIVSEVLERKRSLTLEMIRNLHHRLEIPADSLLE